MPRSQRPRNASKHALSVARPRLDVLEDRSVPGFLAPVSYPLGGQPQAVAAGDFNRDGAPDLAVANGYGGVTVLLGNGDGSFRVSGGVSFPWSIGLTSAPDSVVVGDLNADGKLDLVAGVRTFFGTRRPPGVYESAYDITSSAYVVLGNGDGTFQAPRSFAANTSPAHMPPTYSVPSSVAVGDLNGDGTLDIAVTSRTGFQTQTYYPPDNLADYVTVLVGHGDGTFSASPPTALNGPPGSLVIGDFNTDGHLDLVAAGGTRLLSGGDGTFQVSGSFLGDTAAGADFNGDGYLDLAVGTSWTDAVRVSPGNGDGTFQAGTIYSIPMPTAIAVGDFNRDGRRDLAAAQGTGQLGVLLGDDTGGFQAQAPSPVGATAYGMAVGDFNADLFPDVGTANKDAGTASVLVNNGNWTPAPLPRLIVGDASVREGNTGQTLLQFGVTLSTAAAVTVTVHWATRDGTAASGSDYQAASGTLSFLPGQTSKTLTVAVYGDRVPEPDETFFVDLSQATNATLADGQGLGTIVDDEPRITITDAAKREGRSGTTLLVFTVKLSGAYDQAMTINFATADGTATAADHDYQPTSGTLTFAPGETSKTIAVVVYGDRKIEGDETFSVNLTGASSSALITDGTGIGTILNDDN